MRLKSLLAMPYAGIVAKKIRKQAGNAVQDQEKWLQVLLKEAKNTSFGKDHKFSDIATYQEFQEAVGVKDYEDLRPYIDMIKKGTENVLWKGRPLYFAKTSGTTSGAKYIPISKDSIHNHIDTARSALLNYMDNRKNAKFVDGKMIFLSGSPVLTRVGGIPTGRLSGIVNHHIPNYLKKNQLPSYSTNCIDDWEEKLAQIIDETIDKNMTLISGIPPWMQMYFDWILERKGAKNIKEVFPNLQVLVHGGVNFAPYRDKLMNAVGPGVDTIELFPASEGFFAFQDQLADEGLLLNTNSGIFYEFIPVNDIGDAQPKRLSLGDVELNKNYAMIINSNAGLWGYNLGDTVEFVSLNPYRVRVTGRIKHYISAFGEHVIGKEVDEAIQSAAVKHGVDLVEYTVAPMVTPTEGLPYHEWFIEANNRPSNIDAFIEDLNNSVREQNIYYDDLIRGNILKPLVVVWMKPHSFVNYMKSLGKLGGQNKLPRLSNDRKIAKALEQYKAD